VSSPHQHVAVSPARIPASGVHRPRPSGAILRDRKSFAGVLDPCIAEKTRFKNRTNEAVILLKTKESGSSGGLESRQATEKLATYRKKAVRLLKPSSLLVHFKMALDEICDSNIAEKTRFKKRTNEPEKLLKIKQVDFFQDAEPEKLLKTRQIFDRTRELIERKCSYVTVADKNHGSSGGEER
jgi:hypothetical protein